MGIEGVPEGDSEKITRVKKPYYDQDGELLGHEIGDMTDELNLARLHKQGHKTVEFETESGNVYTIRMIKPMDTDRNPKLNSSDTAFLIENKRTGSVEPISADDLDNGVIRVGEQFHWHGGNSTKVKSIVFYTRGSIHTNIK